MAQADEEALEEVGVPPRPPELYIFDILQRLKAALWFSIGKIVDEETLKLGVNATPHFIGALTEMVWAQIGASRRALVVDFHDG